MPNVLNELFPQYPFETAMPYRITVNNKNKLYSLINNINGIKRLYYSLYNIDKEYRKNPNIDKIFFDLDSNNSVENIKKMHKWAKKYDYKHLIIFSGGGFHFYIFTKNGDFLRDSKSALTQAHHDIAKEIGLTIGEPKFADIDNHIIGDIQRIATIPNTYNVKRKKFAIPVEIEMLENIEDLKTRATKQKFNYTIYGTQLFDMKKYQEIDSRNVSSEFKDFKKIDLHIDDQDIENLPPCVQQILLNLNDKGNWKGRYYTTCILLDMGYELNYIDNLAKKYFSKVKRSDNLKDNYHHYCKVKVLELATRRGDMSPSCIKLNNEGYCPGKCKWYNVSD